MTMIDKGCLQQLAETQQCLAASCGFTINYQNKQASQGNVKCYKELAPLTYEKHDQAAKNWIV